MIVKLTEAIFAYSLYWKVIYINAKSYFVMANIIHWILPKEQKFFHMLREQSLNVINGAEEFKAFIEKYDKLNDNERIEFVKKLKAIEAKGDELAHNIIGILDKTFITPIDKEDIHELSMLLDDIIDFIHETAEKLVIFNINKVDRYIIDLTNVVLSIMKIIDYGFMEIEKLKSMNQFYVDVHTLENKGDDLHRDALARLFDKSNAIDIIKYKEIYELLERIIDGCEDIANLIESVVVKHA